MHATCIILARAGSKGVPGKNAAVVAGRPCVAWTIDDALASETVGAVAVSTDSEDVALVARQMGVRVLERPAELAGDDATVDDAARDALAQLDAEGDRAARHDDGPIILLYGNVPLRPPGLIDRAVRLLVESGCDSVQSYAPVGKHHPWWTCRLGERGEVAPWEGETLNRGVHRRQDLPPAFIPDGGVIALTRRALERRIPGVAPGPHAFFGADRRGIETGEGEVVDIDSPVDLVVADALLRERTRNTEATEGHGGGARRRMSGRGGAQLGGAKRIALRDSELTEQVIGAAIDVHRALGPGLLESAYEACLADSIARRGFDVQRQVELPVVYESRRIDAGYRIDLLVEDRLVVEVKAADRVLPIHEAQLLTYLRLSGHRVGLLLNFNVSKLRDGITRRVL